MSYQVEVLPVTAHPLYDTRESGKTHTPFPWSGHCVPLLSWGTRRLWTGPLRIIWRMAL